MLGPTGLMSLEGGLHLPEAPRAGFAAPAGPRPALFSVLGWQGPPSAPKSFSLCSGAANLIGGRRVASTDPGGVYRPLNSLGVSCQWARDRLYFPSPIQTGSSSSRSCWPGMTFALSPNPPLTSRGPGVLTPGRSWTP